MKKKLVPAKSRPASGKKRTAPKRKTSGQEPVVMVQRVVIISACVVLAAVGVVLVNNKPAVSQAVAGITIAKGLFAQATIDIPEIDEAVSFNIYYKKASDNIYTNAVRNIPVTTKSYTISYLTRGAEYDHRIVAVDAKGSEFWFSPSRPILEIEPM